MVKNDKTREKDEVKIANVKIIIVVILSNKGNYSVQLLKKKLSTMLSLTK